MWKRNLGKFTQHALNRLTATRHLVNESPPQKIHLVLKTVQDFGPWPTTCNKRGSPGCSATFGGRRPWRLNHERLTPPS